MPPKTRSAALEPSQSVHDNIQVEPMNPTPEVSTARIIELLEAINDRKLRLTAEITGSLITYCIAKVIQKCGMSTTEARRIKAGSNNALGDGILGLLPSAPLMITKNTNQSLGITLLLSRTIIHL